MLNLLGEGWLQVTELPKVPGEMTPQKTLYLWSVPHVDKLRALMRESVFRTLLRLQQRLRHEEKEHHIDEVFFLVLTIVLRFYSRSFFGL